jgi:hypothetical protein
MTPKQESEYCREIEAHLCRKNDGHLIRIVGPAFELVSSWAHQGIPLTVAFQGIDRSFERYYRQGPRRRPVRIEFCEADVLDAFDAWRRAVGVPRDDQQPARTRQTLASHVERVIARLTSLRGSTKSTPGCADALEDVVRALDALQPSARQARGKAREEILAELDRLDALLMNAATESLDQASRENAMSEAMEQLEPFRDRMATDAFQRAIALAVERAVRDRLALPHVSFE